MRLLPRYFTVQSLVTTWEQTRTGSSTWDPMLSRWALPCPVLYLPSSFVWNRFCSFILNLPRLEWNVKDWWHNSRTPFLVLIFTSYLLSWCCLYRCKWILWQKAIRVLSCCRNAYIFHLGKMSFFSFQVCLSFFTFSSECETVLNITSPYFYPYFS